MRYIGQAYEIAVPFEPDYREVFHRLHARLYGYANAQRPTEIVQLRVKATGRTDKPLLQPPAHTHEAHAPAAQAMREVFFAGASHCTAVYHLDQLAAGSQAEGPAILLTGESTNVIAPGWAWRIDPMQTVIATRPEAQGARP